MSDEVIAVIVTIAILALLFAWAPFLNFICPPCSRYLHNGVWKEKWLQSSPLKRPHQSPQSSDPEAQAKILLVPLMSIATVMVMRLESMQ